MQGETDGNTVGLIGVGRLGMAMARNLLERGHRVVGYRRGALDELVEAGGDAADSPAALARDSDFILICVPDGEALRSVLDGEAGLASGLGRGQPVFDLGTYDMAAKHDARARVEAAGSAYFDCAVSGNPSFVTGRTASIFVSGEETGFDEYRPVLEDVTGNVTWAGAFGAGTALKLIVAALVPVHTLAAAEAMSFASRAGIDRQLLYDAIVGTPASSGMFEVRGKAMISGDHAKNVTLAGYLKNIELAMEFVQELGGEYPLLSRMCETYRSAAAAGFGPVDQSAIVDYLMGEKPES